MGLDTLADLPRLALGGLALKVSSGPLGREPDGYGPLRNVLPAVDAVDAVAIDRDVAVARTGVVPRQVMVGGRLANDSR